MSDLFVCDKCTTVDSMDIVYPNGAPVVPEEESGKVVLECTTCKDGGWHDLFDEEKYRPGFDVVVNRPTDIGLESSVK